MTDATTTTTTQVAPDLSALDKELRQYIENLSRERDDAIGRCQNYAIRISTLGTLVHDLQSTVDKFVAEDVTDGLADDTDDDPSTKYAAYSTWVKKNYITAIEYWEEKLDTSSYTDEQIKKLKRTLGAIRQYRSDKRYRAKAQTFDQYLQEYHTDYWHWKCSGKKWFKKEEVVALKEVFTYIVNKEYNRNSRIFEQNRYRMKKHIKKSNGKCTRLFWLHHFGNGTDFKEFLEKPLTKPSFIPSYCYLKHLPAKLNEERKQQLKRRVESVYNKLQQSRNNNIN